MVIPPKRKIILHIGTEKTGSTSLQRFLAQNRAALLRQGCAYPTSVGAENHIALCGLAQGTSPKFRTVDNLLGISDNAVRETFQSNVKSKLHDELCYLPASIHTIVFSNEHLHSMLTKQEDTNRLREILLPYASSFMIVAYLRRQDELATSLFSTRIKGGETWQAKVFPEIRRDRPPYYYNYDALLSNYAISFDESSVQPRIFHKSHLYKENIVNDFFATSGLSLDNTFSRIPNANKSLNLKGLYALSLLNKYIPARIDGVWNVNRNFLVSLLEKRYSGRPELVSRHDAVSFFELFLENNERVRKRFFADLPDLFPSDFDCYPDLLEFKLPSENELAEVFAYLWTERSRIAEQRR